MESFSVDKGKPPLYVIDFMHYFAVFKSPKADVPDIERPYRW
jgi:hypothetical protein